MLEPRYAARWPPSQERPRVEREAGSPIIRSDVGLRIGANINGPSLIRTPEWLSAPLGRYHLYFAHHRGSSIRLAYADDLAGPWRIHVPGTLRLDQTPFADHIASPDVHVDHESRRILMYFHGAGREGARGQETWLAASTDGLAFEIVAGPLGRAYWRVFEWGGWVYALEKPGVLLRAATYEGPFERGHRILPRSARHSAVLVRGDRLHVFWSAIGDRPERILHAASDLRGGWRKWRAGRPLTVLAPREPWEGADLRKAASREGIARERVHELRDPCVFEEPGQTWLLYTVAGESGIALARVSEFVSRRLVGRLQDALLAPAARASAALRSSPIFRRLPGMVGNRVATLRDWAGLLRRGSPRQARTIRQLDRRPVFVVGCGRSGTTLMITLLGSQPGIAAIPTETWAFVRFRPRRARRVIWAQLARMKLSADAHRWAEKTPRHVHHLGKIFALYGTRARVILMVRDGRDVVTSYHGTHRRDRFWVEPSRWIEDVTAGWRWEDDPRVITIRYEDLVMDPTATMRRIFAFLGEPFDEQAALRFREFASDEALASLARAGEPADARASEDRQIVGSSVGRWRRLTDDPVVVALMEDPRAVDLLRHYGYLDETEL